MWKPFENNNHKKIQNVFISEHILGTKTKQLDYSNSPLRILHSIEPNLIETTGKNEEGHFLCCKNYYSFFKKTQFAHYYRQRKCISDSWISTRSISSKSSICGFIENFNTTNAIIKHAWGF